MAAQIYTTNYELPKNYQNKADSPDTPLLADDLNKPGPILESQLPVSMLVLGNGVAPDYGNAFAVTAGTGLSVNVASGLAIVGSGNFAVGVENTGSYPLTGLAASRGEGSPIYLFVKAGNGSGGSPISVRTRQAVFTTGASPTLTGAVLLATITTSGSAVLTITMNESRFIPGGQGVPDGGTTDQVLGKTSSTDGAVSWRYPAPARNQRFRIQFSGTGDVSLTGDADTATFTPGSLAAIETAFATAQGISSANCTASGTSEVEEAGEDVTGQGVGSAFGTLHDAEDPAGMFDENLSNTPALDPGGNVGWDFGSGQTRTVTKLRLRIPSTGGTYPTTAFELEASSSSAYGGEETTIYTYSGSALTANAWSEFDLPSTTARSFRLVNTSGGIEQFAEMELLGAGTDATVDAYVEVDGALATTNLGLLSSNTEGADVKLVRFGAAAGVAATQSALESEITARQVAINTVREEMTTADPLQSIIGINGEYAVLVNPGRNFEVDTSGGSFTQAIPTVVGTGGTQLRFTKGTGDANTCTLTFETGEGDDVVLTADGDTVTIQAYSAKWIVVYKTF